MIKALWNCMLFKCVLVWSCIISEEIQISCCLCFPRGPSAPRRFFCWFDVPADIYHCVNVMFGTFHSSHWLRKSPQWVHIHSPLTRLCSTPACWPLATPLHEGADRLFSGCCHCRTPWSFCSRGSADPAAWLSVVMGMQEPAAY